MSSKSSNSELDRELPPFIVVGRIRKPVGIRGEVAVQVISHVPERYTAGSTLHLATPGGQRRPTRILAARLEGTTAKLRLEGCESREDAEALRGAWLEIERDRVPAAPEGAYYFFELVGCACIDRKRGELGRVENVIEDGGGLLLEVREGRRRVLIPFVRPYLRRVDVEAGRIELDLPEGLLDTCASRF